MNPEFVSATSSIAQTRPQACSLFDALLNRRSRRFAAGMKLKGSPLAYKSSRRPDPPTIDEEAALAFAACGVTGYALAELPYDTGGLSRVVEAATS